LDVRTEMQALTGRRVDPALPATHTVPGGGLAATIISVLTPHAGKGCEVRMSGDTRSTSEHAVVIAGGGPTGLTLAGELSLAWVDVAIVERRSTQDLDGSRAAGLLSRTIEVLDQRGIAERFLTEGTVVPVQGYAGSTWTSPTSPAATTASSRCGRAGTSRSLPDGWPSSAADLPGS
jgi:hypothetical protein